MLGGTVWHFEVRSEAKPLFDWYDHWPAAAMICQTANVFAFCTIRLTSLAFARWHCRALIGNGNLAPRVCWNELERTTNRYSLMISGGALLARRHLRQFPLSPSHLPTTEEEEEEESLVTDFFLSSAMCRRRLLIQFGASRHCCTMATFQLCVFVCSLN